MSVSAPRPEADLTGRGAGRAVSQAGAAGLVALAYALALFDAGFITGASPYWDLPLGIQGGFIDLPSIVAAYDWFARSPWSWPLLRIPSMDFPAGMNGYNADFVPLAAILGKLAAPLFGSPPNPYPAWILACFALNGAAMAMLCRAMGARSMMAAIAAGGFAVMLPMLHMRFGHTALLGQWPLILALAVLFAADRGALRARGVATASLLLVGVASFVHVYILVMAILLCEAAVLRLVMTRRMSVPAWLGLASAIIALPLLLLWALGLFSVGGLTARTSDIGLYSANLLSLLWPQTSAIGIASGVPALGVEVLDATGGQYEGYAWLGFGVLLLLLLLPPAAGALSPILARRWYPVLVLAGFLVWAVLPVIHIAGAALPRIPLPALAEDTVFAWLRSNGRMLWPVAYALVAAAIVAVSTGCGRMAAPVLGLALVLQWVDLAAWRRQIAETTVPLSHSVLASAAGDVARSITAARFVQVFPKIFCTAQDFHYMAPNNRLIMEFHLIAARANAAMPLVAKSRGNAPCAGPETLLREDGRLRAPIFVFDEATDRPDLRPELDRLDCRPMAGGLFCTER